MSKATLMRQHAEYIPHVLTSKDLLFWSWFKVHFCNIRRAHSGAVCIWTTSFRPVQIFQKTQKKFYTSGVSLRLWKKLLEPTTSIFLCKQRVRTINLIKTRIRNNVKCVTLWVDPKLVQLNKWDKRDETVCVVLSVYWVFGRARLFCVTWFR